MQRNTFSQELHEVKDEILLLSSMVEQAVMDSVTALKDNDLACARQILTNDLFINRKRFEIETYIMILIATQQPIAHDLRLLASSLDICTELERMGDYAKGIANINLRSEGLSLPPILKDVYSMAEKAVDMLHRAMTAFADEDIVTAADIMQEDDIIDECYSRLYQDAVQRYCMIPEILSVRTMSFGQLTIWNGWVTVLPISVSESFISFGPNVPSGRQSPGTRNYLCLSTNGEHFCH